ncbi:MAG: Jag N-terminal domain-containing protein [Epsilonproteobacteria bacterium]|nr:Jag N-terminal domain-containing protein [Campylobacterota bacterium]
MIKRIESHSLEDAYQQAAEHFDCSITELAIEVIQTPSNGFLGFFQKSAIIVAAIDPAKKSIEKEQQPKMVDDTILPESFVSDQDEGLDEDLVSGLDYTADYDDAYDEQENTHIGINGVAKEVKQAVNELFAKICFDIDEIAVSVYDEQTLLVEFTGEDAALLIGKEGYRYKALSYMLFNWINAKYNVQLRLEIAEFLKNQEEGVGKYLENIYEIVDKDGRAQTKILDGVLVQIALKELRNRYPDKYVVIRSTKEGLKYIIINDYHA